MLLDFRNQGFRYLLIKLLVLRIFQFFIMEFLGRYMSRLIVHPSGIFLSDRVLYVSEMGEGFSSRAALFSDFGTHRMWECWRKLLPHGHW